MINMVMRLLWVTTLTFLTAFAAASQTTTGWQLVWSDEFNGAAGTPPNPANWNYDLGGGGWGNGEAETYTSSPNNVFQDGNGNLVIRAIRDANGNYTSARLQTGSPGASTHTADNKLDIWPGGSQNQAALRPSRVARVLDARRKHWDRRLALACGEVDIMENFGTYNNVNDASTNNGTAHGPDHAGWLRQLQRLQRRRRSDTLPLGETVYDDYHVYAIQWSQDSVAFYVDGALYYTATPDKVRRLDIGSSTIRFTCC